MNTAGLSTDQAPPISVPFRFLFTVPLFGILAGLMAFTLPENPIRFDLSLIAWIHLITIGMIGMAMLGALSQMLPVLAGVVMPKALMIARISHLMVVMGTVGFFIGMGWGVSWLLMGGSTLLLIGFLLFLSVIIYPLMRHALFSPTVFGMRGAVVFGIVAILLGGHLAFSHGLNRINESHLFFSNLHIMTAVFGFAVMLIVGVANQVVPMFYVTPSFPESYKRYMGWGVIIGIIGAILGSFIPLGIMVMLFSGVVYARLLKRRRPVVDTTVRYWKSAMLLLMLGSITLMVSSFVLNDAVIYIGALLIGAGVIAVISGMSYKIVTFLVWFHLTNQGYFSVPTMREMISEKAMMRQWIVFLVSIVGFLGYLLGFIPNGVVGGVFMLSNLLLAVNLSKPWLIYGQIRKKKPDFVMDGLNNI